MNNELLILLAGLAVTLLTQIGKTYGIDQKYIVMSGSLILGAAYYAFSHLVSPDVRSSILVAVMSTLGYATAVYNAWKLLKPTSKNV